MRKGGRSKSKRPSSSQRRAMLGLQPPSPAMPQSSQGEPAHAPAVQPTSAMAQCLTGAPDASAPNASLVRQLSDETGSEEAGLQALVDIVRERERARILQQTQQQQQHLPPHHMTSIASYAAHAHESVARPHAQPQPRSSPSSSYPPASDPAVDTTSDEFRMYHFKVRCCNGVFVWALATFFSLFRTTPSNSMPSQFFALMQVRLCSKSSAHDWVQCPYAHEGEKARRRDPLVHNYSGTACPDFRKGSCAKGDACPLAHGVFECWLHPQKYRTELCREGLSCQRHVCFFAHTPSELRIPDQPTTTSPVPPSTAPAPAPSTPSQGVPAQAAASSTAPLPESLAVNGNSVVDYWFGKQENCAEHTTKAYERGDRDMSATATVDEQPTHVSAENGFMGSEQQQQRNNNEKQHRHDVRSPIERLVPVRLRQDANKAKSNEPQMTQRNSSVPREQSFSHLRWIEGLMDEGDDNDVGET